MPPERRSEREVHRRRLELVIGQAERALAALDGADASVVRTRALATLAKAHAERAEDARYGAGQLSLSAQRAPTADACDEGWQRVAAIVAVAETSARVAATRATELQRDASGSSHARVARASAARAEVAARAARRIVEGRNDAYTFHADGGFSFGEGWYVAAAGLLAGVAIQIEPAKPATAQAERFLHDAGLRERLQVYRSRPRAMKQVTELVARAFAADPVSARRRVRAAFLGEASIPRSIVEWADRRLAGAREGKKVLLWIRDGAYHAHRNTTPAELVELTERAVDAGLVPVWIGDTARGNEHPSGVVDLMRFWREPLFGGTGGRRAQLQLFEHLRNAHGVVGQLGVTTAGMDGPALLGLPTRYLTDAPNVRMRAWVGAIPGYEEIVRLGGYLDRVRAGLSAWAGAPSST
ncbi:MAG TPA: hypothetical protein VIF09_08510 [Polyangiaceae bacterium]